MFHGRITDERGNHLAELGPYAELEDLYYDLMFEVPDWKWKLDYELSIWKVEE